MFLAVGVTNYVADDIVIDVPDIVVVIDEMVVHLPLKCVMTVHLDRVLVCCRLGIVVLPVLLLCLSYTRWPQEKLSPTEQMDQTDVVDLIGDLEQS